MGNTLLGWVYGPPTPPPDHTAHSTQGGVALAGCVPQPITTSTNQPFLAGAKADAFPHHDRLPGAPTPRFPGDVVGFIEDSITAVTEAGGSEEERASLAARLDRLMHNTVVVCPSCGKINAVLLPTCNSCGRSLAGEPTTRSTNVFMCFVLGIQRGSFPMIVSLRAATPDAMVFDDPLALTPLHFNVLPTTHHIPDWRFLLRRPAAGLALVRSLLLLCRDAATEVLADAPVAAKLLPPGMSAGDVGPGAFISGFNFPPSQFQLHMHFMLPAFVPFHEHQVRRGVHFTLDRFFPSSYVTRCLELAAAEPLPPALLLDSTPTTAITEYFATARGHDYGAAHAATLAHAVRSATEHSPWQPSDFAGRISGDGSGGGAPFTFVPGDGAAAAAVELTAQSVIDDDRVALQNYGRPYTAEGKPSGSYYPHPRTLKDVADWA